MHRAPVSTVSKDEHHFGRDFDPVLYIVLNVDTFHETPEWSLWPRAPICYCFQLSTQSGNSLQLHNLGYDPASSVGSNQLFNTVQYDHVTALT